MHYGKSRRGSPTAAFAFSEGSSENKTAAIAGGRLFSGHRDEDFFRPWQDWQRPTLPSLET
jgi:hypothetical protein